MAAPVRPDTRWRLWESEEGIWTPAGQRQLAFYMADPERAWAELFRIRHKDRPRAPLIPFTLNLLQRALWRDINRIRAINIRRQAALEPEVNDWLKKRIAADIAALTFKEAVPILVSYGVSRLVFEALEESFVLRDGPVQMVLCKHRQGGMSTLLTAIGFHQSHFFHNWRCETHAQKGSASENVLGFASQFYTAWNDDEDRIDFREKTIGLSQARVAWAHGSAMTTFTAGSESSSRSFKADYYHFTEYAHYPDTDGANAALGAQTEDAWVMKESTAAGVGGSFHDEFWDAKTTDDVIEMYDAEIWEDIDGWSSYYRFFFGWVDDPSCAMACSEGMANYIWSTIDDDEQDLIQRFPYLTAEKLRWRRWKLEREKPPAGYSALQWFRQENPATPHEAFQATGLGVFDAQKINRQIMRADTEPEPLKIDLHESCFSELEAPRAVRPYEGHLEIFEPPIPGQVYTLGGDVSQGLPQGDFSVGSILRRVSLLKAEEVACWEGKISAKRLGDLFVLLALWYNEAFILCEVNGPGVLTNDRILDNQYPNTYERIALDKVDPKMKRATTAWRYGFFTLGQGKQKLVNQMAQALVEDHLTLHARRTLEQAKVYRKKKGAGYEAPSGHNDDRVVATGLAYLAHIDDEIGPSLVSARAIEQRKLRLTPTDAQVEAAIEDNVWSEFKAVRTQAGRRNRKRYDFQSPAPGIPLHPGR